MITGTTRGDLEALMNRAADRAGELPASPQLEALSNAIAEISHEGHREGDDPAWRDEAARQINELLEACEACK